jgi:PAS domain S-box-containing protein
MEARERHLSDRPGNIGDQTLPSFEIDRFRQHHPYADARPSSAESRNRHLDTYDIAPIACLVLGYEDRVVEMNAACTTLLGVERGKLIFRNFTQWVDAADQNLWLRQLMLARCSNEAHSCELQLRHADGTTLRARMVCRQEWGGSIPSICIFFTDLTWQKQMEAEILEWRNKLSELHAMHVAAQTAASIVHELNQPLLAITSYSDAADMLLKNESPDMALVRKAIDGCRREAARAGHSMRELLELFRKEVSPAEVFDLNKEIENILTVAKTDEELRFEHVVLVEEGLPPVRSNRTHLQKVLFNLLHNAVEAMADAGVVQPVVAVKVQVKQDENVAQVTVQDNGPGISREQLHRLFDPFFTTKSKGTGMGLAVSRSLIEENGGRLWADLQDVDQLCLYPQERKGATFHFTLPFAS